MPTIAIDIDTGTRFPIDEGVPIVTTPTDTTVPTVPTQEAIDALNKALVEAESNLAAQEKALVDSMKKGDVTAMLAVVNTRNAAVLAVTKAKRAYDDAVYLSKNQARINASVEAKAAIMLAVESPEVINAFDLGVSGISITRDAEGHFTVTVAGVNRTVAKAPRAKGESNGSGKGRIQWSFNGQTYTSRQLLEANATKDYVAEALNKVDNWKELGLKFSPGFDTAVKKLAAELGAVAASA